MTSQLNDEHRDREELAQRDREEFTRHGRDQGQDPSEEDQRRDRERLLAEDEREERAQRQSGDYEELRDRSDW